MRGSPGTIVVQLLDVLVAVSSNFPEKARYWESLPRTMGLTVALRTAAAANPMGDFSMIDPCTVTGYNHSYDSELSP
jgi:hypothetical protein